MLQSYILKSSAMAPMTVFGSVIAGPGQWPFNPALAFLGIYLFAIAIAVPAAAIAAWMRWGRAAKVESSGRQRLVDVSIAMLAAGAALGWAIVAFVISGAGSKIRIPIKYDFALVFVPPVLALSSGIVALVGKGKGRAVVISGFILTLLGCAVVVISGILNNNAPSPSY